MRKIDWSSNARQQNLEAIALFAFMLVSSLVERVWKAVHNMKNYADVGLPVTVQFWYGYDHDAKCPVCVLFFSTGVLSLPPLISFTQKWVKSSRSRGRTRDWKTTEGRSVQPSYCRSINWCLARSVSPHGHFRLGSYCGLWHGWRYLRALLQYSSSSQ